MACYFNFIECNSFIDNIFFFIISILLINITFGKTSSNDDEAITKKKKEDQNYIIFVSNAYGEFNIFSNPNNKKNEKREELKSYEYAVTLMDKIDELINENRDTYKDQEKLEEIENKNLLRKRDDGDNQISKYDNSSFVNPISSIGNSLLISAYLSEILVEKIKKMENIESVIPDIEMDINGYYNKADILENTSWKGLTVQEDVELHLSMISQGLYNDQIIGAYDTNYYYPESAGNDIDIIIVDSGFDFSYSEYSNTSQRTAECKIIIEESRAKSVNNKKICGSKYSHGIEVADVIGGSIYGVAKNANIYGVTVVPRSNGQISTSDVFMALEYIKENMIRKHKTIVNVSLGTFTNSEEFIGTFKKHINSITEKGGLFVATSGNKSANVRSNGKIYVPCVTENAICVGGVNSLETKEINKKFEKNEKSGYGDEVKIYGPIHVKAKVPSEKNPEYYYGTSFSAGIVSGVIATIMSDTGKNYDPKTMLNYLIKKGIPFEVDGETRWVINNGKQIVYSKNSEYNGCGINAGNIPCNERCGPSYGKCRDLSACCSSKNYCNTTSAHCGTGCQPKYGLCISKEEDRCGPGYGRCPSGECCSKYGWCGTKSDYCGTGCQPRYGLCN